jgi:hypothetical protein
MQAESNDGARRREPAPEQAGRAKDLDVLVERELDLLWVGNETGEGLGGKPAKGLGRPLTLNDGTEVPEDGGPF